MREMRIECFRAGESTLSYCLPQVLRITCSGVLRTLICSYLDTGKKRCLKIGKSHKMKKTCVFLGSWILSPVMQCDQRHPLFLGGDGRAAQRFKQMIESLNHRTQREHSLSEEPLLCANRPAMQCIVGLRKATTYELASRKANTERIDGLQGFAVFMAFTLCLPTTLTSNLTNMRQAQAATEAAQEYASADGGDSAATDTDSSFDSSFDSSSDAAQGSSSENRWK